MAAGMTATLLRRLLARLSPGDRAWLAGQMMQGRFDPATRAMAEFCLKAVLAWKNKQYAVTRNGEATLLERLRPFAPRLLVDVGANVGDWSLAACRNLPEATVHAFEIAPSTAANLIHNTAPFADRMAISTIGLGENERAITLYVAPQDSTIASTVRNAVAYSAADEGLARIDEIEAHLTTGDAYLGRQGIDHVDMLKIDVEGAEFSVLRGFAAAFTRGAIDLVQFEYGPLNLGDSRLPGRFLCVLRGARVFRGQALPGGRRVQGIRNGRRGFRRSKLHRLPHGAHRPNRGTTLSGASGGHALRAC